MTCSSLETAAVERMNSRALLGVIGPCGAGACCLGTALVLTDSVRVRVLAVALDCAGDAARPPAAPQIPARRPRPGAAVWA